MHGKSVVKVRARLPILLILAGAVIVGGLLLYSISTGQNPIQATAEIGGLIAQVAQTFAMFFGCIVEWITFIFQLSTLGINGLAGITSVDFPTMLLGLITFGVSLYMLIFLIAFVMDLAEAVLP